jgi:protein phosphatase
MDHPETGIRLRGSARTNVGQVRQNNEDHVHLWTHQDMMLAIVADGMGGAAAGEEASRLAVEAIRSGFDTINGHPPGQTDLLAGDDTTTSDRLRDAIFDANQVIVDRSATSPDLRGMGTTVTLVYIKGTYAIFAHVGDSRAYVLYKRTGTISQITSDHSFVDALLKAGHITPEQAEDHPMKHVLYRALGQTDDIDIDMYYKRLHVGDYLILCSDGLTRHLKPEEIGTIVTEKITPEAATQALIDTANSRGGEDNISAIVIAVEGEMPADSTQEVATLDDDRDVTLLLTDLPDTTRLTPPEPGGGPEPQSTAAPQGSQVEGHDTLKPDH